MISTNYKFAISKNETYRPTMVCILHQTLPYILSRNLNHLSYFVTNMKTNVRQQIIISPLFYCLYTVALLPSQLNLQLNENK